MDSTPSFNSDSTYCSAYENSKESHKIKCKKFNKVKSSSQFLDNVHNEVLLHLEGKLLMGRIQVQHYLKKISKMRLRNAKNQYFAEKIRSSLLKILKLTKQFERSFSLSQVSLISDPLENYKSREDIKFLDNNTCDPKHILLGCTSVNHENNSFPLDLLTDNNFTCLTSQNSVPPISDSKNPLSGNHRKNKEIEEIRNKFRGSTSASHNNYSFPLDLLTNNNFTSLNSQNSIPLVSSSQNPLWRNQGKNGAIEEIRDVKFGGCTSESHENNSFPLDLLTNNNFGSSASQNSTPINDFENPSWENLLKNKASVEIQNKRFRVENLELFSSNNTEVYIEPCSGNSKESNLFNNPLPLKRDLTCNPDEVVHSTNKNITTSTATTDKICIYENNICDFINNSQNNDNKNDSGSYIISKSISISNNRQPVNINKGNKIIIPDISKNEVELSNPKSYGIPEKNNINEAKANANENNLNKEFNDIVSRIINEESYFAPSLTSSTTEISETCDHSQKYSTLDLNVVKKANLNTVMKLSDFFDESYNKKIGKLCYGLGKQSEKKTWPEIHNELEYNKNVARNVNHTLIKLFENLSLAEQELHEREYKNKLNGKGSDHNFSEEDEKKLNWTNLIEKNMVKLENISEEFRGSLIANGTNIPDIYDGDDDFDGLCWQQLLV